MSGEDKNKLDELFKSELDNPVNRFDFLDQDWDAMEQLLDADKKPRGLIYWLPMLSGVAALLLIALGWWYFKTDTVAPKQPMVVHQPKTAPVQKPIASTPANIDKQLKTTPINNTPIAPEFAGVPAAKKHSHTNIGMQQPNTIQPDNAAQDDHIATSTNNNVMAANGNDNNNAAAQGTDSAVTSTNTIAAVNNGNEAKTDVTNSTANVNGSTIKVKKKLQPVVDRKGPQFGLAVMLSPDINGVKSFQDARVGTNVSMLFSVSFGKLSVSTGATYSKKPYLTDFNNYHTSYTFKTNPESVYADCRVLDIPLNVDYQVYHKAKNSFSVGSGLSSYIMLKEKYTYDYEQPNTPGPQSYTVVNRNRHILGVLNLNATYARQLNTKFSLTAQPYLKIPLTNIGYSQVRLRSAGVALGLRWNINQSKTP